MYTNPTDYFMGLMKDEGAAGALADAWRKSDAGVVSACAPLPIAPISKRAVADDPTLNGDSEGYDGEPYATAHSVLEVGALCQHYIVRSQRG